MTMRDYSSKFITINVNISTSQTQYKTKRNDCQMLDACLCLYLPIVCLYLKPLDYCISINGLFFHIRLQLTASKEKIIQESERNRLMSF